MTQRLPIQPLPMAMAPLIMIGAPLSLAPTVTAAEAKLEEIIVTASKMEESMQDVSVAVTAFSVIEIDHLIMRDIREIMGPRMPATTR